jgi:aminopeptidase N
MRTDQARPVRLQDYRPSDWLIDKVDLDIALHPSARKVRAAVIDAAQSRGGWTRTLAARWR